MKNWRLAFGVWRLAFGVWRLAFGVWRLAFGVGITALVLVACGGSDSPEAQPAGNNSLQLVSGDTSARIDVGSSKSVTAQYNQTVAQIEVASLPVGLSITSRISGGQVQMTVAVQPEFSFVSGPEVSVPVQITLTDAKGGMLAASIAVIAVDLQPIAITALNDLRFSDNVGYSAFILLNSDGSSPTYPFAADQITNPAYSPIYGCFYSCMDPYNSHWAVNIAASDTANRDLIYSMQVSVSDSFSDVASAHGIAANLSINPSGMLTQKCNGGNGTVAAIEGLPPCYDSVGYASEVFTVTITATPKNGYKKLTRSFKMSVRNDG